VSGWDRLKRARYLGGIVAAIAGGTQAPPPGKLPEYLQQQYRQQSEVRLERTARDIKRLTTKDRRPQISLSRKDAKRLRGKH
jgi:hypothetical protein